MAVTWWMPRAWSCVVMRAPECSGPRAGTVSARRGGAQPQLLAQPAELPLLVARESRERRGDAAGVCGKDILDRRAAGGGEVDNLHAPVVGVALAAHPAVALQVVDDGREVAAAHEQLVAEPRLRHRPEMKERLEHAELADGEAVLAGERRVRTAVHAGESARELDVGVEREDLARRAAVVRPHAGPVDCSTSNICRRNDAGNAAAAPYRRRRAPTHT